MGGAVTPFTSGLLKVLLHRLGDEDADVKANAAFAVGVLVQETGKEEVVGKAYGQILTRLEPMLQDRPPSRQLDNAAGCVSRMIMRHKERVPLGEVLPVLVGVLPLQEDFEENGPVYRMVVGLCMCFFPWFLLLFLLLDAFSAFDLLFCFRLPILSSTSFSTFDSPFYL